jgi:hypothetical protein
MVCPFQKNVIGFLSIGLLYVACQSNTSKNSHSSEDPTLLIQAVKASHLDSLDKQVFNVSADSASFIVSQKGALLVIHPQSFLDESGKTVQGAIQVEFREAQAIQDFVKARISTVSDGKILQTAGSYYVAATQNGKELRINQDGGIFIGVPSLQKDTAMRFFIGEKNEMGDINWKINASQREEKIEAPKPPKEMLKEFSLTPNEEKLKRDYEETVKFLKRIDEEFVLESGKYIYKHSKEVYQESWEASFVKKIRQKLKNIEWIRGYLKSKEQFHEAKNQKLREAWERYNKLNQAWKDSNREMVEPTFYEYKINQMGWLNIDKFVKEDMTVFKGNILNEQGQHLNYARVHLISEKEKIHLQTVCETGRYEFKFPSNKPFKILVFRGKQTKEIEVAGNSAKIPDIKL